MALQDRLPTSRSGLAGVARDRFGVDARSLAAFRVALGLLLLADLLLRARDLAAFYTDDGVLPRSVLVSTGNPLHLSLHVISGEAWFQALLFAVAGAFAVALAVGYRTSVATVGSWLLLVSLHNRNGLVLNGGDFLLRLLLFWALFLPLAERWSVDAQRRDRRRNRVVSTATAALLLQVVAMYTTNAGMKLSGDVWVRGDGLEYVFSLGQFTVLLGDVAGSYPLVLGVFDYVWLGLITCSALLILLPGLWRTGFVFLFVGAHLGMALTMRIDLFPFVSIVALLPFLPAVFWETVLPRAAGYRPANAIGRVPERLAATLPVVTVSGVSPRVRRWKGRATTVLPVVFLVLVLLWNVQVAGYTEVYGHDVVPDEAETVVDVTRTDQYWNMFAPDPLSTDGWIVTDGRLENGSHVNAFHGGEPRWDRPPDVSETYPTARWRKYLVRLWRYDTGDRERFAEYLCHQWNDDHETRMENVTVYYVEQPTRLGDEPEPTERVTLAEEYC